MKRIFWTNIGIFFCLFIFFSNFAIAHDVKDHRDLIVKKTLDCLDDELNEQRHLKWDTVCYVAMVAPRKSRSMLIEDALDNVAKSQNERSLSEKEFKEEVQRINEDINFYDRTNGAKLPLEEEPSCQDRNNILEIGTYVSSIAYREPDLMDEKGMMSGVTVAYTHRISENQKPESIKEIFTDENKINVFKVEGLYGFGEVDYHGNGTSNDIDDYMIEMRGLAGYEIPATKSLMVTPYAGFGYRYLNDGLDGAPAQIIGATLYNTGYERESRYFYVPFGVEALRKFNQRWSLGFMLEYDLFVYGKQTSHLEDQENLFGVNAGYDILENDQDSGFGIKSAFKLIKAEDEFDFLFEVFIRYWNIEESKSEFTTKSGQLVPVSGSPGYYEAGIEPKNNSTEYGFRFGANF